MNVSKTKGLDRSVLNAIARRASDETNEAFPSISTLARSCGIAERTVYRCVRRIHKLGEIKYKSGGTSRDGKRRANTYRLTLTPPDTETGVTHGQGPTPCHSDTRPPDTQSGDPCHTVRPISYNDIKKDISSSNGEKVLQRLNTAAAKSGLRPQGKLTKQDAAHLRSRMADDEDFWQVYEAEAPKLDRGKGAWLTIRWILKTEQNYQRFKDGEFRKPLVQIAP